MIRIRTGYSFRAAVGSLEDVMARLIEVKAPFSPITDRASTFGFCRWVELSKKHNLKPLLGVEIGVTRSLHEKKPVVDYWTFFARQDIAEVNRLLTLATSQFRYEPLINYEQALSFNGFKITGYKAQFDQFESSADLFVALSPSCSKGFINEAIQQGHSLIAASDNKYPTIDDLALYEVVCGRNASTQTYAQHILSEDEWRVSIRGKAQPEEMTAALDNARMLGEQVNAGLRTATLLHPDKPKSLRQLCIEGAAKKNIDLSNSVYAERLERELNLIEEKEYEDYFHIIQDLMSFARERMICGPARGSSCGSLVCYLLNITTVDPIKFSLIFERFIDINRGGYRYKNNWKGFQIVQ